MKPDLEVWERLYDIAIQIREKKPWEMVSINDLIVVKMDRKTYYCNIIGQETMDPCIAIYTGKKGLEDVTAMLNGLNEGWNGAYLAGDQDCLICYYGDRDEVPEDQMDIIHALKPGFKGKGNWIFCKHVMPRYYPVTPENDEINTMIKVFEGLIYGIDQLKVRQPDWSRQYLCVSYSKKEGTWTAKNMKHQDCFMKYYIVRMDNPSVIQDLKNSQITDDIWFVDLNYLFMPLEDETGRKVNPLLFLMLNLSTELIEDMTFVEPKEDEVQIVVNYVCSRILDRGRPKGIVTRCPTVYYAVQDICDLLDIDLMVDFEGHVSEVLDEIIDGFLDFDDDSDTELTGLLN